jgi:hypothetical protein
MDLPEEALSVPAAPVADRSSIRLTGLRLIRADPILFARR